MLAQSSVKKKLKYLKIDSNIIILQNTDVP